MHCFFHCSISASIFFKSSSQPEFLSCTLLLATQPASTEEAALLTVTTAFCITKEEEIGKQGEKKDVEMGACRVCGGSSPLMNMCVSAVESVRVFACSHACA